MCAYVLSAAGIPVYLHYCGGTLEQINYVVKSKSCCGNEEDDSTTTNDCCRDENVVLQNAADFTLKQFHHYDFVKTFCDLFYVSPPFSNVMILPAHDHFVQKEFPPPDLQQQLLVSTSVLRI